MTLTAPITPAGLVRKDAALIARLYRAIPLEGAREEREERFARNRLARGNARRFLMTWLAQQVK